MRKLKNTLYIQLAKLADVFTSHKRIEIIECLAQSSRNPVELSNFINLNLNATKIHVRLLIKYGLVSESINKKSILYTLAGNEVIILMNYLRITAEKCLPEVIKLKKLIYEKYPIIDFEISSYDLFQEIFNEDVLILDIRPENEFEAGHIEGAVNIEPENVDLVIEKYISEERVIITYCRGEYCTYSYKIASELRDKGCLVYKLKEGFPEWKAAGLPYKITA